MDLVTFSASFFVKELRNDVAVTASSPRLPELAVLFSMGALTSKQRYIPELRK